MYNIRKRTSDESSDRMEKRLRGRIDELEKELKAATDALAIKNSEMEHVRSVGLRMLHVADDVVSCNRGEGRYISEKTNDDPLYADAGSDLVGDDYDNFSPLAHGFWSGALATARLLYLPASIENWEEDGYYTDFGDEIDFEKVTLKQKLDMVEANKNSAVFDWPELST